MPRKTIPGTRREDPAIAYIRRQREIAPGRIDRLVAARTELAEEQTKLRRLEFEAKSGKLVDADGIRSALFNLWRAERDAWLNWPARAAPIIAAEFGCDAAALVVALERSVRAHLTERTERPALMIGGAGAQ